MTYPETLDFIGAIERFGSKPGLERVRELLERMGNPQKKLRFIHVAGTNGKGSTCAMLSHVLEEAGYRTGLFISPYVLEFRERIQLNNELIEPEELAASATVVKAHWDDMLAGGETATQFEVVTAIAMDYFARKNCDVVVLEVGLGGRFDATNIIDAPIVSVITNIGLDHTEYLGDTIARITAEKCGIIKPGGATACYPRQDAEALAVVMESCAVNGNRLFLGANAEILRAGISGTGILYEGQEYFIPLIGEHQVWNAVTVIEAVKAARSVGLSISDGELAGGIAETRFPGRLEPLAKSPVVLLDGAHNPQGGRALAKALELLAGRKIHAVVGMMADKDVESTLQAVLPLCNTVTAVAPSMARAMPPARLFSIARKLCPEAYLSEMCAGGFLQALFRSCPDDAIVIFGSLYLASELRPVALLTDHFNIARTKS